MDAKERAVEFLKRYNKPNEYTKIISDLLTEIQNTAIFNTEHNNYQKKLEAEVEHLRVQLAGCGVAAMCNTLESMEQQCVDRDAYGWSASYGDVLEAVKREIKYREALKAQLELVNSNIITTWPDIAARLIAIAKDAIEI